MQVSPLYTIVDRNWHLTAWMEGVCPQLVHGSFLWEGDDDAWLHGRSEAEVNEGFYALRDGATLRHDQLADVRDTRILPYLHPDPSDATQLVVRLGGAATVATVRDALRRDGEREKGR
jgi:hypothetical protein